MYQVYLRVLRVKSYYHESCTKVTLEKNHFRGETR